MYNKAYENEDTMYMYSVYTYMCVHAHTCSALEEQGEREGKYFMGTTLTTKNCSIRVHVHESLKGVSSTTIPKPRGIPPSVCSGTTNLWKLQKGRTLEVPSLEN